MPKLIIDNKEVEVPEGTNVLEAARSIGIVIPHFCWHPALEKAGACRVCAVKILEGPVKGLQMSCMLPAVENMVVSTDDEEAVKMRRAVIEWLMINHPHDCPVCDEGGECQLQDFTIAGGHGIRRYNGKKRTYVNQFLGNYIEHEMNRCIQCYRCSRFYQDYAGGSDFGVMGRANSVYFGRQQDGHLESSFSGNLVDICPTGVFTDKTARFSARYWDYDMGPSICPLCSLGCNIVPMARYRELLKVTARCNKHVNDWFICDRGRFSNSIVNALDRPRQAMVDSKLVSTDQALNELIERLGKFLELHGPDSIAIVGSTRMSLESNIMAARLKEVLGTGLLSYFYDEYQNDWTSKVISLLNPDNTASQEDVRRADLIVLIDCDLLDEAPMMALAVRQAWRNSASVYIVRGDLAIEETRQKLFESVSVDFLTDLPLSKFKNPVIICGKHFTKWEEIKLTSTNSTKFVFIMDSPNSFGCAILSRQYSALPFSQVVSNKRVKGIISFEADLPDDLLDGITIIGSVDWKHTNILHRAEVVLPSCSWVEQKGTFVNYEGRAQRFEQIMLPGLPHKRFSLEHPPRSHSNIVLGGDVLPTWKIIWKIFEKLGIDHIEEPLSGEWKHIRIIEADGTGKMMLNQE